MGNYIGTHDFSAGTLRPTTYGFIEINSMQGDTTSPPTSGLVGLNPCLNFNDATDQIAYFNFMIPEDCATGFDIVCEIAYCMASANTTDDVVLGLDANSVADAGDATPATESATTQTITVPDTAEIMDIVTTSTLKIPTAMLAANNVISCKFYRDANAGGDTAAGNFQLLNFRLRYTRK